MSGQELKVADAAKAMAGGEGRARPAWLDRIIGSWHDFTKFLHDVRGEMGHVTWPSFLEVRSQTLIVIVTIFFSARISIWWIARSAG